MKYINIDSRMATSKRKLKYKPFGSRVQLSIIYIFHSVINRKGKAVLLTKEECIPKKVITDKIEKLEKHRDKYKDLSLFGAGKLEGLYELLEK